MAVTPQQPGQPNQPPAQAQPRIPLEQLMLRRSRKIRSGKCFVKEDFPLLMRSSRKF